MAGAGITKLRNPTRRHNPARAAAIETIEEAEREDRTRAAMLRRQARLDPERAKDLEALADRIDPAVTAKPTSCASKRAMRKHRRRIGGELRRLHDSPEGRGGRRFDLLPHWTAVTPEELLMLDAERLGEQLRADLNRAGARLPHVQAGRFAFIGLDGEYNPDAAVFHLHFHGFGSAAMLAVIRALRKQQKYKRRGTERPPVRILWEPLRHIARALTYCVKGSWFERWRGTGDSGDKVASLPRRISEPAHSLWLLWMDQQRLEDMVLMMGLRVVNGRLEPR